MFVSMGPMFPPFRYVVNKFLCLVFRYVGYIPILVCMSTCCHGIQLPIYSAFCCFLTSRVRDYILWSHSRDVSIFPLE